MFYVAMVLLIILTPICMIGEYYQTDFTNLED